MKIGLLAYSTNTGLGYQTYDFFKNMEPAKVLVADLSRYNKVQTHHERYLPEGKDHQLTIDYCNSPQYLSKESCEWLVDGMDVVFVCETPLNYYIYEYAKKKGVKVVQQYNYEFLDYFRKKGLPTPDVLASPSYWGLSHVESLDLADTRYWPVPIDTDKIPFREFSEAKTLVHIVGRPAAHDRNGTLQFLQAAMKMGDEFNYKIYLQPPSDDRAKYHFREVKDMINLATRQLKGGLEVIEDIQDNTEMFASGEIMVLPRKYGGLCLPMWEALSAGMPVVMTNTSPNETNLPNEWLCDCTPSGSFMAHTNITLFKASVDSLINTIRFVARNIEAENKQARGIANAMSWELQKDIYNMNLKAICA
jgi:glycosyltransferase involved in cell wall biosynthesis